MNIHAVYCNCPAFPASWRLCSHFKGVILLRNAEDEHQRLQSVFAASIIPRLRWLHEGILHLHFTCPKPDVLESMVGPSFRYFST